MQTSWESKSTLNHVIGPVMRGPSSSHTAGAYHIGRMARSLLGAAPLRAEVAFDTTGSYGKTFREQGADKGFVMGLREWLLTDPRFDDVLTLAAQDGLYVEFSVKPLAHPEHPNTVDVDLESVDGCRLHLRANSIGGGAIEVTHIENWQVRLTGESHVLLIDVASEQKEHALARLTGADTAVLSEQEGRSLIVSTGTAPFPVDLSANLRELPGVRNLWTAGPLFFVQPGPALFRDAAGMVVVATEQHLSLGEVALRYEAALLGLTELEVLAEMDRRLGLMERAVREGLQLHGSGMQLLRPTAGEIWRAEASGALPVGGLHTRAAIRAMAVMHVNGSMGVVCAAPTGGAAGALPGVLVTLLEDLGIERERVVRALFAAGAIGLIVASRATFAAEVAGCQVEIGAAGAMAAAAVADVFGGNPQQATDAAAIAFQNTMGSVCDLVQGMVEIPCHTRNAAAASNAFLCADLILGGYVNPIPLDETIDAVYAVGKMLPAELRCTALGGLAITPSALAMERLR